MPNYRRMWRAGGLYFFTVTLFDRREDLLVRHINALRTAVRLTRNTHPFAIHAWVVLPDHLHCVFELPAGDIDFAMRWRVIKRRFSSALPRTEYRNLVRVRRRERGVWARRYWEHLIRDEADYRAHLDYVHFNPVKHDLVKRVIDWPYSTFHRWVRKGVYPVNWGEGGHPATLTYDD